MIEINLLPEELKKKKKKKKEQTAKRANMPKVDLRSLPFLKILAGVAVVLVILHVLLLLAASFGKRNVISLSAKYNAILPKKKESDVLKANAGTLRNKVNVINELMVNRFSWAKKLNALGDSVTPGIWLSQLEYEEKSVEAQQSAPRGKKQASGPQMTVEKYLIVSGYASSMGEQGTAQVGKFIKGLKDNGDFYSDFSDIQLGSIKTDRIENQEVMSFKITCLFKK